MSRDQQFIAAVDTTASVLAILPDVALVLDGMARINFASAGSDQFLGSRPRDWVGLSVLDQIHPDDVPSVVERLTLARCGKPTPTSALRIRVSDGADQWGCVAAHGFIRIDADGLVGTLVLLRDVTGQLTRNSAKNVALEHVFNRANSKDALQRTDQNFVATELLPRLLSQHGSSTGTAAVIVMTLAKPDNNRGTQPRRTLDNPVAELAHRVREILRPGDVFSRLGESQLVIVCGGLTAPADGLEIAHRLHNWCSPSPLRNVDVASLELTTGFAIASAGDEADAVLRHAASKAGVIDSAAFVTTAA